ISCYHSPLTPTFFLFFFNTPPTTEIYTLSLHDALPISAISTTRTAGLERHSVRTTGRASAAADGLHLGRELHVHLEAVLVAVTRSEEHTSELQSRGHLVCRLLLEKKKKNTFT